MGSEADKRDIGMINRELSEGHSLAYLADDDRTSPDGERIGVCDIGISRKAKVPMN